MGSGEGAWLRWLALGLMLTTSLTASEAPVDQDEFLEISSEGVSEDLKHLCMELLLAKGIEIEPVLGEIIALKLRHEPGTEREPVHFAAHDGSEQTTLSPLWYMNDRVRVAVFIPHGLLQAAGESLTVMVRKGDHIYKMKYSYLASERDSSPVGPSPKLSPPARLDATSELPPPVSEQTPRKFHDALEGIELRPLIPLDPHSPEEIIREKLAVTRSALERRDYHTAMRTLNGVIDDPQMPADHADAARVTLARILLGGQGRGLRPDRPKAVALLRDAADNRGYPDAQALLGFLYASGYEPDLIPRDTGRAFVLWNVAAKGDSLLGQMSLGFRHLHGIGVEKNCSRSAELYRSAALHVLHQMARPSFVDRHLGESVRIDTASPAGLEEIIQHYRQVAARGDVHAQLFVGRLNYYGAYGVPQDLHLAARYFTEAADAGDADARTYLGHMSLQGTGGLEVNYEKAFEYFESAERSNKEKGRAGMGFMLLHGLGVEKDEKRAIELFKKSPKNAEALYNLGLLHLRGHILPQDTEQASLLLEKSASLGNQLAMFRYAEGLLGDSSKECPRAVIHLKEVAELGPSKRLIVTALEAFEAQEEETALFRYLLAAHAGHDVAQYNAAYLYENSIGTMPGTFEVDPEYALELYDWSSRQGKPEALLRVGDLIYENRKDFSHAATVYREVGSAEAMFNLGVMHARGLGVPADLEIAKRWFDQASEASSDAMIPTTIALFLLKFYGKYKDRFSLLGKFYVSYVRASPTAMPPYDHVAEQPHYSQGSQTKSQEPADMPGTSVQGDSKLGPFKHAVDRNLDYIVLGLLGISLGMVLLVRQRRLLRIRDAIADERVHND